MRHLRSLCYALVLAPTAWTLSAVAFTQQLTGRGRAEGSIETFTGFLLLLLAGAAYAILLLPRLSPVGPATTGLIFLVTCIWVLNDAGSFDGLFPAEVRKPGFDLTLPADGLAALLAVPLLCTALSRRRWRAARFEPVGADTGTIIWPFARPARPGTLVVPGVTGVPTSDATLVLPVTVARATDTDPAPAAEGDRTQVIPPPPTAASTQAVSAQAVPTPAVPAPADATQVIPPTADATQIIPPGGDVTGKLPSPAADATQTLPPSQRTPASQPTPEPQPIPQPQPTPQPQPIGDTTQKLPPADGKPSATDGGAPTPDGADPAPARPVTAGPGGPLPAADPTGPAGSAEPAGSAGPADDGATQLVPATSRLPEQTPAAQEVDSGSTIVGAERPVDEAADDTTRLSEPRGDAPTRR